MENKLRCNVVSFTTRKPVRVICSFQIFDSDGSLLSEQSTFFDLPKDETAELSLVPNFDL